MSTTIRSTALDFDNIKNNLKTFLSSQTEFEDYNFEASGLSNILDVLAYNTHINGLIANFALNESYLNTAQLRSSVISLAEGIGYIPDTDTSSQAKVNISFSSQADGRSSTVELPPYTKFTADVDGETFTFQTIESFYASDDGTGFYEFTTGTGSNEIPIFQGTFKTKTFVVGEYIDNPVYIIPDKNIDADTVVVRVFESATSTESVVYNDIVDVSAISANSRIYILKESPNGFFELSFGDGETFGIAPSAGNRIQVEYISTAGSVANGAKVFSASSTFTTGDGIISEDLTVTTIQQSVGGDSKESIESIRKNAPYQYASQNRMVTAADYSSLILRNYSTLIKDIKAWGGEDNADPEFGAVYVSIIFEDGVTAVTQASTKTGILALADQLAVISFRLRFSDPVTTYIEVENFFQINPNLTSLTLNTVQSNVSSIINNYFKDNTGGFDQSFRKSSLLSLIDESSPAILSSRANIKMQQRFEPDAPAVVDEINTLTNFTIPDDILNTVLELVNEGNYNSAASIVADYSTSNYTTIRTTLAATASSTSFVLTFPASISAPDDVNHIITSTSFTLDGIDCIIRNRLGTTSLEVVSTSSNDVVVNNIGSYNATSGRVTLTYFSPSAISGNVDYIKLSAVPANESAITPTRNDILEYDPDKSSARAVTVTATN